MVDYDMHIHSSYSDGILTPEGIFKLAQEKGLKGLALTDHDTIKGLNECKVLSEKYNLDFIPGIELGTYDNDNEIHILGYYIDYENDFLKGNLKKFQDARFNRAVEMVRKINNLGFDINLYDVLNAAGEGNKAVGRPHIARTLVSKGYFKNTADVFERLIGNGKPAYAERFKLPAKEGIELIEHSGGIAVLAHPALIKNNNRGKSFESFLEKLVSYGLKGIEVYHTRQNESDSVYYQSLANKYNLLVSGGSDCHGICEQGGYLLGKKGVAETYITKMKRLKGIIE